MKHWSSTVLEPLGACPEAVEWAQDQPSLADAWLACEHPAWMFWLMHKTGADLKLMVHLACDCAETTLPTWLKKHPDDDRPANAIRTARAWANGKAKIEDVRTARTAAAYAASAAAAAAYADADADAAAASAAAYAAYAAAAAAYADAAAAAYAAAAAAYAAYAADAAAAYADAAADAAYADAAAAAYAAAAARRKAQIKMANLIRKRVPVAPEPPK